MNRLFLVVAALFLTTGFTGLERAFLPKVELLSDDFLRVSATAQRTVDHDGWDRFLETYVEADGNGINRVDYAQVSQADRTSLVRYLDGLEAVDPAELTRDQQLAFWINLYNATTVNVILDNYPVESIRDIGGFLEIGPWDRTIATIAGHRLTLNDIEHRIIRPIYDEHRIHYALNCAATGCPNLMDRAWRAESLEADLAAAERAYVNDPRGIRIDRDGALVLSKIYGWFREDFGRNETAVIASLLNAAGPELKDELQKRSRVDRYEYDWSLNDR